MNARNLTALFVSISLFAPSLGYAGQAVGTAKARGDYRGFYQSQNQTGRSVARSRPAYRYSTPVIREAPSTAVAQAPVEARRFSQAPAANAEAAVGSSTNPCQGAPVASAPSTSARRYSYAPATEYSTGSVRRYSGNVGRSSEPLWSLQKTDPRKFNAR